MATVGIDLGTTHSCVAIYRNKKVEIIPNELGMKTTPSIVYFGKKETIVGQSAKPYLITDYANVVTDIKRIIGQDYNSSVIKEEKQHLNIINQDGPRVKVPNVDKAMSPEEISGIILSKMKKIAESYLNETVENAVITVPAYFDEAQKNSTKTAAQLAGLNPLRIINEPTAAALSYESENKTIVVFDLGGGTFDVSILSVDGMMYEVIATSGDSHLGGEDFDNCLVEHCMGIILKDHSIDEQKLKKLQKKIKVKCEEAKKMLASAMEVNIMIEGEFDIMIPMTRRLFNKLCKRYFQRTLEIVKQTIKDAQLKPSDIDDIILVGGSTRIIAIQDMLSEYFSKPVIKNINPDEAIATGAAMQAANLTSNELEDLLLVDVTSLSIGIEESGNIMKVVIPRNSRIPTSKMIFATTNNDNQTRVAIRVYQGERARASDNKLIGQMVLTDIIPAAKGTPRIVINMGVTASGMIEVSARDEATGKKVESEFKQHALSPEEIDQIISKAEENAEADKELVETVEEKNKLEKLITTVKNFIREHNEKIPEDKLEDIKMTLEAAIETFGNSDSNAEDYKETIEALDAVISSTTYAIYEKLHKSKK